MSGTTVKFRRVLMKLSGEALLGSQAFGADPSVIERIAGEIRAATRRAPR